MIIVGYYFDSNKKRVPKMLYLTEEQVKRIIPCGQASTRCERWCVSVRDTVYFFETMI